MKVLRCPLCRSPFHLNTQGLTCKNGHQFDRAKEGYFNLLPVQNKRSLEPGDAKEQLLARREFLQAGFFDALKNRLSELIPSAAESLLDIGCGEGYFTRSLALARPQAITYGIDIAKAGVKLAAKSAVDKRREVFAVASSFDLPFADHCMDVVTRIYAPSKDSELWRVIKPGGFLVIVAPAENHLLGLRQRLYEKVRAHAAPPVPEKFNLLAQERLSVGLRLDNGAQVKALLSMTPFAWKMAEGLRAELESQGMVDQLDFLISVYQPV